MFKCNDGDWDVLYAGLSAVYMIGHPNLPLLLEINAETEMNLFTCSILACNVRSNRSVTVSGVHPVTMVT